MEFSQLLDQLPRSTFKDWINAAEKQLKGRLITSINVDISDDEKVQPFALGGKSGQRLASSSAWRILGGVQSLSGIDFTQQLAWGAQGGYFSFDMLRQMPKDATVRFDYLSCFFSGESAAVVECLKEVVDDSQQSEAEVFVETQGVAAYATLKSVKSNFKGGGIFLPSRQTEDQLLSIGKQLKKAISSTADLIQAKELLENLVVEVDLTSSYLSNLLVLRALRLVFANICVSFGIAEPLNPLRVLASIQKLEGQTSEEYLVDASAQAVAAISSSVDFLVVRPYDESNSIEVRRSLNLQHVLAIESQFELAGDPVQGAAFIESASEVMAKAAWGQLI